MKQVDIYEFIDLDDAFDYMEKIIFEYERQTEEIDAELKKINGRWRVGVTINGRQKEFDFFDFD